MSELGRNEEALAAFERAFKLNPKSLEAVEGIAVTAGPGLIGGVIVGLMTAKAIASVRGIPMYAVNHLEGHALSVRLSETVEPPFLLLLVSGGHCQLITVGPEGDYALLGTTIDDAVGEAFDKTAKLMGMPYPGGPEIEKAAQKGNPSSFDLPRPLTGTEDPNFSFSGLKTAVRRSLEKLADERPLAEQDKWDMAASFQTAAGDVLVDRSRIAMRQFRERHPTNNPNKPAFVVAGGVAANQFLRAKLATLAEEEGFVLAAPPLNLCTDNAAMIALVGLERLLRGDEGDPLSVSPRARWPLGEPAAVAPVGGAST